MDSAAKPYRITTKDSKSLSKKSVQVQVEQPVLDYYNKMSLNKLTKYVRIKHKSTSTSHTQGTKISKNKGLKKCDTQSNQEWEKSVDRYMQSKESIEARRNQDLNFGFRKLDKANKKRYIKLIQDQQLPVSLVHLAKKQ